MELVLLTIAIGITVVHVTLLVRSRRFKKRAAAAYESMMQDLRTRTASEMKRRKLKFDKTYPFVSDNDNGYLLSLDTQRRQFALADDQSVRVYHYDDLISSSVDVTWLDPNHKKFESASLHLQTKEDEHPIIIDMGTTEHKANSVIGNFILKTTQQVQDVFQNIINAQ